MVSIIAARSKNGVIGKDGQIPWRISGEQSQFKELTTGNAVIMGRKSYEEIGKPLPHRLTVVVSSTKSYGPYFDKDTSLMTAPSLEAAIKLAKDGDNNREVYVAGGEGIFKEALSKDLVDKVFLTEVDTIVEGDNLTMFPQFDEERFCITKKGIFFGTTPSGEEISYTRTTYARERTREQEEFAKDISTHLEER